MKVHNCDCMAFLKSVPAEYYDCILTDPPYSSGGAFRGDRVKKTSDKYQGSGTKDIKPEFYGDTRDQISLEHWCAEWLRECWRVSKEGAFVFVFIDWRNVHAVITALQMAGFVYRGILPWIKKNTRPQNGTFAQNCEYVVYGTRGGIIKNDIYRKGYFIQQPLPTAKRIHATEKPVPLLEYLLSFTPKGGRVFDPFAGSGSTAEACLSLGLDFDGCELSADYCRLANERIDIAAAQGRIL